MTSPANDADAKRIEFLEKINELIDLCIDNGDYEAIKVIIPDDALSDYVKIERLRKLKADSEYNGTSPKDRRKEHQFVSSFSLGNILYPVKEVRMLPCLQSKYAEICSSDPLILEQYPILRPWSCLLWAKFVRAELHRKNRDPWLKLYDNIIFYLEENIVLCRSAIDSKDLQEKTLLNYLMELSAASLGEASLGYAERAKKLCNEISRKRDDYKQDGSTPYDRWIWYNKGIAYQHTRRSQEAIGEFSEIIDKFFNKYSKSDSINDINVCIEYLLNIAPSFMQTAEMYIKGQLAYHALKFLDDNKLDAWLKYLLRKYKDIGIIVEVASKLIIRKKLLALEARLRLGNLDESKELIRNLHGNIEISYENQYDELPELNPARSASLFQVKFIEQKVIWYRERARQLLEDIKSPNNARKDLNKDLKFLTDRINAIKDRYWVWVQDNPDDKNVYYSNWAQFLGIGMKIIQELVEQVQRYHWSPKIEKFLYALIELYIKHRKSLPDPYKKKDRIAVERLRDPFDIVNGLNNFYEGVIFIRDNKNASKARNVMSKSGLISYNELKKDHFQMLSALDKWDRDYGEDQNIEALKRCNMRIKWISTNSFKKFCDCFEANKESGFKNLLECRNNEPTGKMDDEQGDKTLKSEDYNNIMSEAEEHFRKHLKDNSSHVPDDKATLHFLGLQRWNSLTPAQGRSVGGGYFIYHTDYRGEVDLGIAIDPGFDFVRNFFRQGYSIRDIDIVLISHAHADHLWDFESIVQLLHDLSKKKEINNRYHRMHVILTKGVYQRYERNIIENQALRQFIEPLVVDLRHRQKDNIFVFRENMAKKRKQPYRWKLNLNEHNDKTSSQTALCEIESLEIIPTYAYHDDYSNISDSYGFIIKFQKNGKSFHFGYTGDTKWVGNDLYENKCPARRPCNPEGGKCQCIENVANQYRDCDTLLLHLGSLIDHKNKKQFSDYKDAKDCVQLVRKENHPYLPGMIRFLKMIKSNNDKTGLVLIGEFGEELRGGIRVDIVARVKAMLEDKVQILPVDVGLDIVLWEQKYQFICALCNKPRLLKRVEYERYGYDEAIFYVCHTCFKAWSNDVRQDRYRKLYDVGKELIVLPNYSKVKFLRQ